jgi:hypothetical protein
VGLPLVGFGVCLLWVLFGWTVLGLLADHAHPEEFTRGWPGTVVEILWPTFLLMQLAGLLLCVAGAPKAWHIRTSEAPAVAVTLLHLGLFLGLLSERWQILPASAFWLLLLLGPALHLNFLINFAPRIDQELLGKRAERLLFPLLILCVFPVLFVIGALAFGGPLGGTLAILLYILLGVAVLLMGAALVQYVNLHLALHHAIPVYLETFADKRKLKEAGWVDPPAPW